MRWPATGHFTSTPHSSLSVEAPEPLAGLGPRPFVYHLDYGRGGSDARPGNEAAPVRRALGRSRGARAWLWKRPSGPGLNWACLAPSSRGLGHHPLKVKTRVRIPLGLRSAAQRSATQRSQRAKRICQQRICQQRICQPTDLPANGSASQRICQCRLWMARHKAWALVATPEFATFLQLATTVGAKRGASAALRRRDVTSSAR